MRAIREGIFRLVSNGIIPIVTHPECNPALLDRREKVLELIEYGCLIQVTAGSFTGIWGDRSQRMAEWLLSVMPSIPWLAMLTTQSTVRQSCRLLTSESAASQTKPSRKLSSLTIRGRLSRQSLRSSQKFLPLLPNTYR